MSSIELDLAAIKARQATLNLGTLGNVSEGKSTFVRSISGVATQKHQKEKQTNITIHLGYAGFKIWRHIETGDLVSTGSSAVAPSDTHELVAHYSFVDCPGHEAYLATMMSGAAIMDASALLIASNVEGIPQIQTQEHLMAAEFMNLAHVFTIQNKLDLVADPAPSFGKIKEFVSGTVAEAGPIIPLSAQRGWGLDNVLHHLTYGLPEPVRTYNGALKMMIVRSFDINKPQQWIADSCTISGGVLGGTILSGVLQKDDIVEIRPGLMRDGVAHPILTRVKSLYCDSNELPLAIAGGLVGIGTTLDPTLTSGNGLAGQLVGTPGTLPPITLKLRGTFRAFRRDAGTKLSKQAEGDHIKFCVGIMTVRGKISKIVDKHTRVIKLVSPVCVSKGQVCGILRSNGERDLLDGVFVVETVVPFDRVEPWLDEMTAIADAEKARVLARKYIVKEHDIRKEAEPLPSYERMLESIESLQAEPGGKSKLHIPAPEIGRLPKKSVWINSVAFFDALRAATPIAEDAVQIEEHFQNYLAHEFSTTLTVKGDGQYLIKGRFTDHSMKSVIGKYLKKFHMCKQCGSLETTLVRRDKAHKILCSKCTSYSPAEVE